MRKETGAPEPGPAAEPALREVVTVVEELAGEATLRVAVAAVVTNPLAGRYEEDLGELVDVGAELGRYLASRALRLLEGRQPVAVGKAALVGQDGELEHAAALVGPGFGAAVRQTVGASRAGSPSVKRLGGPGAIAEVVFEPLEGASGAPAAMEVRVPGHPRDDEAVVVLALVQAAEPRASRTEG